MDSDAGRPAAHDSMAEPTLTVVLAAAARRTPDGVLALLCAVGVIGLAVVLILVPAWWRAALVFAAAGALGAWAIADRELRAGARHALALRVLQSSAALVGVGAVFGLGISLLGIALGMWKS